MTTREDQLNFTYYPFSFLCFSLRTDGGVVKAVVYLGLLGRDVLLCVLVGLSGAGLWGAAEGVEERLSLLGGGGHGALLLRRRRLLPLRTVRVQTLHLEHGTGVVRI